jgi:Mg-chelatase subunit ChlD
VSPEVITAHDESDVLVALTIDAEAAGEQPTSTRHIVLCLDASGSMTSDQTNTFDIDLDNVDTLAEATEVLEAQLPNDDDNEEKASRLDHAKAGALDILEELETEDYISVIAFGSSASTEVDPIQWSEADQVEVADAISDIGSRGRTDVLDGLETAWENLQSIDAEGQATRQVILLSDGKDNENDDGDFEEILPDIRADGVKVMTGGIGPYDDDLMSTIADETDGISQHLSEPADIETFIETTVNDAGSVVLHDPAVHVKPGDPFTLTDARVRVSSQQRAADDKTRDIETVGDINRIQLPDVAGPMTQQILLKLEGEPRPPGQTAVLAKLDIWAEGDQRASRRLTVSYQNEETGIKPKVENLWKRIQVRSDVKTGNEDAAEDTIEDIDDETLAIELREQTDLEKTKL